MANTAGLASRRFDTVSLIKIVLCFYLALAPALSHASAAPNLIFSRVENFVKAGGGIVADYVFSRGNASNDPNYNAANDNYYKKNHAVSNSQMGKVWRNRWAGLSNGIGGGLLATAAIAGILAAADWILDPANNTIRKKKENINFVYCYTTNISTCGASPQSPFAFFLTANGDRAKDMVFKSYDLPSSLILDDLKPGGFTAYKINYTDLSYSVNHQNRDFDAYVHVPLNDAYIDATDSDIAAAVAQAAPERLAELATSPDYVTEQHAPTIAAAADAVGDAPSSSPTEGDKKGLGTKVETTTQTNPDGSTTTTTTTTQTNPDGTPALNPDGTPKTPHVQTTTTKPDGTTTTTTNGAKPSEVEPPAFCDWAKTLCSWLDWTKAEPAPANPAQNKVDIKDRDTDDIPGLPTAIDTSRIQWAQVCPAPITANFSLMGQSVGMSYKFDVVCDFAAKFRPYVIGLSYLTAAYIVMGLNRTRSE